MKAKNDPYREARLRIHDIIEKNCKNCTVRTGLQWGSPESNAICNACEIGKELQLLGKPLFTVSNERKRKSVGEGHIEPKEGKPMAARTKQRGKVVPVKNFAAESSGTAPSKLKEYKMSQEELEDYRARTGYKEPEKSKNPEVPAEADKPVGLPAPDTFSPDKQAERDRKGHDGRRKDGPSSGLTKRDVLIGVAKGESMASIEKAWGMKYNTIHSWVKKWGLSGITPGKARELLAKMGSEIDADDSEKATNPVPANPGGSAAAKSVEDVHQEGASETAVEPDVDDTQQNPEEEKSDPEQSADGIIIKPGVSGVGVASDNNDFLIEAALELNREKDAEIERLEKRMKDYEHQAVSGWSEVERLRDELAETDLKHAEEIEWQRKENIRLAGEYDSLKETIEEENAASNQIVRMLNETKRRLNDLQGEQDTLHERIHKLAAERDAGMERIVDLEARIAELDGQLAAAQASAMVLYNRLSACPADPPFPFPTLTLTFGLIDFGGSRIDQMVKVLEEANEYIEEIESSNIDINRTVSELFDVGQAFAGLIIKQLQELCVEDEIGGTIRFFEKHNKLHLEKMVGKVSRNEIL